MIGASLVKIAHRSLSCLSVLNFFSLYFLRDARVVKDMATGKSKGYGFVSFFNKWVSHDPNIRKCRFLTKGGEHLHLNAYPRRFCCGHVLMFLLCWLLAGCRECHSANGRSVVGRQADQD